MKTRNPNNQDTQSLEEAIWEASLDGGPDEQIGESETTGWYGLMRKPVLSLQQMVPLSSQDIRTAKKIAGAIIYQGSQGGHEVTLYHSSSDLHYDWKQITKDIASIYDQENPVKVRQLPSGKFRVTTKKRGKTRVHAFATTKAKAESQAKLLRAIEHGWQPTGKTNIFKRVGGKLMKVIKRNPNIQEGSIVVTKKPLTLHVEHEDYNKDNIFSRRPTHDEHFKRGTFAIVEDYDPRMKRMIIKWLTKDPYGSTRSTRSVVSESHINDFVVRNPTCTHCKGEMLVNPSNKHLTCQHCQTKYKYNPDAKWHRGLAKDYDQLSKKVSKKADNQTSRHYFEGMSDAHRESESASRSPDLKVHITDLARRMR